MTTETITRPVPTALWSKDHWSTFAYAETTAVERQPLALERMRCDSSRHPLLVSGRMSDTGGTKYPTRLKDSVEVDDHDDWDCLNDAQAAGFLKILGLPKGLLDTFSPGGKGKIHPNLPRKQHSLGFEWSGKPTVKFTELGQEVAALLRQHKQAGGMFGTFCWPKENPDE